MSNLFFTCSFLFSPLFTDAFLFIFQKACCFTKLICGCFSAGTIISWGTWQRTPVQTTQSSSNFQVRVSDFSVSQLNKHSLILVTKMLMGSSSLDYFYYLFICQDLHRKPSNRSHPKARLIMHLPSILVCHFSESPLKIIQRSCDLALLLLRLAMIPWALWRRKKVQKVLHMVAKQICLWSFGAGSGRETLLSLLGWQTD